LETAVVNVDRCNELLENYKYKEASMEDTVQELFNMINVLPTISEAREKLLDVLYNYKWGKKTKSDVISIVKEIELSNPKRVDWENVLDNPNWFLGK
jgi:hypothetical protein